MTEADSFQGRYQKLLGRHDKLAEALEDYSFNDLRLLTASTIEKLKDQYLGSLEHLRDQRELALLYEASKASVAAAKLKEASKVEVVSTGGAPTGSRAGVGGDASGGNGKSEAGGSAAAGVDRKREKAETDLEACEYCGGLFADVKAHLRSMHGRELSEAAATQARRAGFGGKRSWCGYNPVRREVQAWVDPQLFALYLRMFPWMQEWVESPGESEPEPAKHCGVSSQSDGMHLSI